MISKNEVIEHAANVATSTETAAAAGTASMAIGVSTIFNWIETGVGFAAALMGLMVTIAIYRKLRLEQIKLRLEIQELRNQP